MAVKTYIDDSGVIAREIKKLYVGDANGIAREVKTLYVGDSSNIARKIFEKQEAGKWETANQTGIYLIAYGAGIFLSNNTSNNAFYYGTDGLNWKSFTVSGLNQFDHVQRIFYENNTFWLTVALNNGGSASTGDRRIGRSSDGINWTISANALPANSVYWRGGMAYGNGTYVILSFYNTSGSKLAAYSLDGGVTWKSASLPTTANWMDAAYGAGKFVAISQGVNGAAGNAFVYSTNGITWTAGTMPASALWYKITYGNGVFIASASNKSYVGYSTDGVNWTTKTLPVSKSWRTLLFGDGEFVMVGYNSNVALHSKDGINWTQSEIPLTKNWLYCAYGDKKFAFTAQGYSAVYSK